MASESAQEPPTSVHRFGFKPENLDPLSRVIYTQTLSTLKPLRTVKLDDPQSIRTSVIRDHHSQLSTLVSTISAADTDGLTDQQKLALNLGKLTALLSKRLVVPLNKGTHRPPIIPQPTLTRKRAVAPVVVRPATKKMMEKPPDEGEPCYSGTATTTNETLSSLLAVHLESAHQQPVCRRMDTVGRPITVVRAAPGAAPVKVVVANRNGAAARVVATRRPVPGQMVTVAARPTVSIPRLKVVTATRTTVPVYRPPVSTGPRPRISGACAPSPSLVPALPPTLSPNQIVDKGQLSKRLRIHPDACYGCCEVDKPETHPTHACPFCGLMIEGLERLEHVKESHPDRYNQFAPFICVLKECDYRTTSRISVKAHCSKVHTSVFDQWEAKGRFRFDYDTICPQCAVQIKDLRELRMHVRTTHDVMPTILCETCCETCTTISELFLHWVNSPFCDGKAKLLDCREESFLSLFS